MKKKTWQHRRMRPFEGHSRSPNPGGEETVLRRKYLIALANTRMNAREK